jgi:hypothetical protein
MNFAIMMESGNDFDVIWEVRHERWESAKHFTALGVIGLILTAYFNLPTLRQ